MQKRGLIYTLLLCLVMPCLLVFTGCFNTGAYIDFETWDGSSVSQKHYETGASISPTDMPSPTMTGYKFAGWCYDKELTRDLEPMVAGNMAVTYYAKYTIDNEYFDGTELDGALSRRWSWSYGQDNFNVSGYEFYIRDYYFLIDKTNSSVALHNITVSASSGSGFFAEVKVYDQNGKPIQDTDDRQEVFAPVSTTQNASQYVVRLVVKNPGYSSISVS